MRKGLKSLYIITFFAILLNFIIPGKLAYARSYEISKYESFLEVKDNSDVDVVEKITYDYSGQYNGMLRDLDLSGTKGVENLKIYIIRDGIEVEVPKKTSLSQSTGFYEVTDSNNLKRLKVYEQSNSVEKTIVFKYTLKSLAERYQDSGTLNKKVIDSKWEVPLNMVSVEIKIPDGAKKEDLRIFSHGDLRGYDEIIDNRTFKLQVPSVDPGETVETQILFPRELLANSTNDKLGDIVQTVLKREKINADEANRKREIAKGQLEEYNKAQEKKEAKRQLGNKLSPGGIIAGILGVISSIIAMFRYGRNKKPEFQGDYYRELPEDYSPAVMAYLMYNGKTESKEIMSTLLDLARKDIITIQETKSHTTGIFGRVNEETDFLLKPKNLNNLDDLKQHEQFLYSWFIEELGSGDSLSLDVLRDQLKGRSYGINFARNFSSFKNLVQDEVANYEFWESNNLHGIFPFVLFALIVGGFGGFLLFGLYNAIGLIPLVIGGLSLFVILGLSLTKKLTHKGVEHTAMWRAFRKFLLDFSNLKDSEMPALSIWKHYLVYATSLGVAKEVIDQLPKVYSEDMVNSEMQRNTGYYTVFTSSNGFDRMDRAIASSVNKAFDQVRAQEISNSMRSSSSGFGGGFSGGSSGGSGGGGGGGAF